MTAAQTAGAGDAVGLEPADRGGERRDAGEMGAVGAGAGDEFGMAVEEERNIAALNDGGDVLARLISVRSSLSSRRRRTAAISPASSVAPRRAQTTRVAKRAG